jgi:tetratricopeptide (TPR) repeat protein
MRPILVIGLVIVLGFLIYSQRDRFWTNVVEEIDARRPETVLDDNIQAPEFEPDPMLARTRLGDAERAYDAGDFEAAKLALQEAIQHGPDESRPYQMLGLVLSQENRYEDAQSMFVKAIERDSLAVGPLIHLVNTCASLRQYDKALYYLDRAERLDADNPRLEGLRSLLGNFAEVSADTL